MHLRRTKTAQTHAQETIGSQSVRSCDCGNHESNVLQARNWTSDTSVLLLPSSSGHGHPGCYTVYLEGTSSSILPPKLIPSVYQQSEQHSNPIPDCQEPYNATKARQINKDCFLGPLDSMASMSSAITQNITNVVFGITATVVGGLGLWQGHRAWRMWRDHHRRQAAAEDNETCEQLPFDQLRQHHVDIAQIWSLACGLLRPRLGTPCPRRPQSGSSYQILVRRD